MLKTNSRSSIVLGLLLAIAFTSIGLFGFIRDLQWNLTSTPTQVEVVQKGSQDINVNEQKFRNSSRRSYVPYGVETAGEIIYLFDRFSFADIGDTVHLYRSPHQPNRSLFQRTPRSLPVFLIFVALSLTVLLSLIYGLLSGQLKLTSPNSG